MRNEYDFSQGERGKYAQGYEQGTERTLAIRSASKSSAAIDPNAAAGTAKQLIKKNSELFGRLS